MNLPDTSVWFALAIKMHQHNRLTSEWFNRQKRSSILLCRATVISTLRLLTTHGVMKQYDLLPMTNTSAWNHYESLRADARIRLADEPKEIEIQWKRLALRDVAASNTWMDTYLAAFAIAGGYRFVTLDQDFEQFDRLKVIILK